MKNHKILIVDNEEKKYEIIINSIDMPINIIGTVDESLKLIEENKYLLVLIDMSRTETASIEMLQTVKKISPDRKVIMLTKNTSIKGILNAMKRGAHEFI